MGPNQDNQNTPAPGGSVPPGGQFAENGNSPAPPFGPPRKSKKMRWIWIIIILLILLGLFAGWWWWKDKDKKEETTNNNSNSSQQQQTETETVTCDEGFAEYENEDLGIGFCYPEDWSDVAVADGKFAAADTGERWIVKFASKPMVNLGVVSTDWSTEVPRDGVCVDPAVQTLPAFSPFSTSWTTEGTPVSSATRGIEVEANKFLIQEEVDDLLTNGVCLTGYTITDGDPFTHTAASYSAEFGGSVTTPQQHIDNPNVLIPAADREEFYTFVKSVHKL